MVKKIGLRTKIGLELFRLYNDKRVDQHKLGQLFWESTLRCNLSCRHCGSDCTKDVSQEDMPLDKFLEVVDSITPHVNPHELLIIIGGGECLMRKDIEQCGLELYKRGYPWGIVSNAMGLTDSRLKTLVESGLRTMALSFDGFKDEHNWMRGSDKSFDRVVNAIDWLNSNDHNIVWDVVTCINKRNISQLEEFKQFLISKGVKKWRIFTIFPVGRAAYDEELKISDAQFRELMEFISTTRKEGLISLNYSCEGFLGGYEGDVRDGFYHCSAGVNIASILVDGSISGCMSVRSNFHQGNVYEDDFWSVWSNKFQKFRNREWTKKGECAKCGKYRYCLGNGMHLYDDNDNLLLCSYKRTL